MEATLGSHNQCNHYSTRIDNDMLSFGFHDHYSIANFSVDRECAGGRHDFFNHGGSGDVFPPTSCKC